MWENKEKSKALGKFSKEENKLMEISLHQRKSNYLVIKESFDWGDFFYENTLDIIEEFNIPNPRGIREDYL